MTTSARTGDPAREPRGLRPPAGRLRARTATARAWWLAATGRAGTAASRLGAVHALLAATAMLPVIGIIAYGEVWTADGFGPAEMGLFGRAGANLLTGHWAGVYDRAYVQGGPFELAPYGAAHLLGLHGMAPWWVFYVVGVWALVALYLGTALVPAAGVAPVRLPLVLGVAAAVCLGDVIPWALDVGHPAQVMVPALWLAAAAAARENRFATAGVLVGLSAGWEVWGVLGAPVLLCAAAVPLRGYLRAAVGAFTTVGVIYGPFVASGRFAMFDFAWPVKSGSAIAQLWPQLDSFPWTLRLLQAAVTVGTGAAVAVLTRRQAHTLWLTPLAVLAVRLVLDPCLYTYYFVAPTVAAVAAVAYAVRGREWAVAAVAALIAWWSWRWQAHTLGGVGVLLGLVLLGAGVAWASSRRRPDAVTHRVRRHPERVAPLRER